LEILDNTARGLLIARLRAETENQRESLAGVDGKGRGEQSVTDFSTEADARIVIDDHLRQAGWDPADKSQVLTEMTVRDVRPQAAELRAVYGGGESETTPDGDVVPTGRADYVLLDQRGRPLAIIEAKRSASTRTRPSSKPCLMPSNSERHSSS
jgi:hypothetical protein